MSLEEGVREGAMAIFEEKYAETVRVVGVGDFSKELCGGVHARSTGQIGLFKILSEAGIASGMRRIEAVTGEEALRYVRGLEDEVSGLEKSLRASRRDLPAAVEKLLGRVEELEKANRELRKKMIGGGGDIASGVEIGTPTVAQKVKGMAVHVQRMDGLTIAELRDAADGLRNNMKSGIVVLGGTDGGKALLVVSVSKDLTSRIQAGALVKEAAPVIGGGGGGRPDFAQAGGSRPGELDKALGMVPGLIEKMAA